MALPVPLPPLLIQLRDMEKILGVPRVVTNKALGFCGCTLLMGVAAMHQIISLNSYPLDDLLDNIEGLVRVVQCCLGFVVCHILSSWGCSFLKMLLFLVVHHAPYC
jgi:hypothetical protein